MQLFSVEFPPSIFSDHAGLPTIVYKYSTSTEEYAEPEKELFVFFTETALTYSWSFLGPQLSDWLLKSSITLALRTYNWQTLRLAQPTAIRT